MARSAGIALWIYTGSLLIWLVARALTGDKSLFVLSFSYMGVWLFFPLLVLGLWVLLKRHKLGMVLLFVPFSLFLWHYGPMFMPRRAQTADSVKPFRVMTFNMLYTNTDKVAFMTVLESCQAGVLALQEVTSWHAQYLSEALGERYPYRLYHEDAGLAVFSTYPTLAQEIHTSQPWAVQSAIINFQETPFHVVNTHLAPPGVLSFLETSDPDRVWDLADARASQIAQIERAIHDTDLPAILACDCNMTDLTSAYARLTVDLRDAFRERGLGLGHTLLMPRALEIRSPINLPVQRIDYLFHSPEIVATKAWVVSANSGSDHLPVCAEFHLKPQE